MFFKPAVVLTAFTLVGAALAAPLSYPAHEINKRAVTVGQWQFTGEVATITPVAAPPAPATRLTGAAKTAYNKAVAKANASQRQAADRTALQHAAQAATQRLLDAAQGAGLQIQNGISVNIWTTWHDHNDPNHVTFKWTDTALCGGECVGHAYQTVSAAGVPGRIFNTAHDVLFPKAS